MTKKIKLSMLITIYKDRERQFEMSMDSLRRQNYPKNAVELVVLLDTTNHKNLLNIVKKYKSNFTNIRCFVIGNKIYSVSHSASRRNFLVSKSQGDYILFSEPEMLHVGETINYLFTFISRKGSGCDNWWYCGPVYGTKSIVNHLGEITVDTFTGRENILFLLNLIQRQGFNKNDSIVRKYYSRLNEKKYKTLFFCTAFNKDFFLKLGGLNQNLAVRGWEEIELYSRFKNEGGVIRFDERFKTVHLPHKRSLNKIEQRGWNLLNSTMLFDRSQRFGILKEKVQELNIR